MKNAIMHLVFVLMYVLLCTGLQYLLYVAAFPSSFETYAEGGLFVLVNVTTLTLFLVYRRRTREKWVEAEAAKWLLARKRGGASSATAMRNKLGRGLLWVPCLVVSLVFPFVPEVTGLGSHVFKSPAISLGKYHVQIPLTWIVTSEGEDHLSAMTFPGVGRIGFRQYWRHEVPLSEMVFYLVPHPEQQLTENVPLNGETILARRAFALGNETLRCWDLIHNNPYVGSSPTDRSDADVGCTSETDHFYARFFGWRPDSPSFYDTLQKIRVAN